MFLQDRLENDGSVFLLVFDDSEKLLNPIFGNVLNPFVKRNLNACGRYVLSSKGTSKLQCWSIFEKTSKGVELILRATIPFLYGLLRDFWQWKLVFFWHDGLHFIFGESLMLCTPCAEKQPAWLIIWRSGMAFSNIGRKMLKATKYLHGKHVLSLLMSWPRQTTSTRTRDHWKARPYPN